MFLCSLTYLVMIFRLCYYVRNFSLHSGDYFITIFIPVHGYVGDNPTVAYFIRRGQSYGSLVIT